MGKIGIVKLIRVIFLSFKANIHATAFTDKVRELEMNEKIDELHAELKVVSDELYSISNEKRNLLRTEDELHSLFRRKDRLFQALKQCWKHGEMSYVVQDSDLELKRHQRNVIHSLEDELTLLNKKTRALEEKEYELRYKARLLADDDDD